MIFSRHVMIIVVVLRHIQYGFVWCNQAFFPFLEHNFAICCDSAHVLCCHAKRSNTSIMSFLFFNPTICSDKWRMFFILNFFFAKRLLFIEKLVPGMESMTASLIFVIFYTLLGVLFVARKRYYFDHKLSRMENLRANWNWQSLLLW